jgi:DNA-binding MarR family transcriptional regulator
LIDHRIAPAHWRLDDCNSGLWSALIRLQAELELFRQPTQPATQANSSKKVDASTIRMLLKARRRREAIFGEDLFADPAWDILLDMYASQLSQRRTSVTDLCHAAAVPQTTALRWISKLERDGWLRREADPFDARRSRLELTEKGISAMERMFSGTSAWPPL